MSLDYHLEPPLAPSELPLESPVVPSVLHLVSLVPLPVPSPSEWQLALSVASLVLFLSELLLALLVLRQAPFLLELPLVPSEV